MTNQTIPPCPVCGVVPEVDLCYTPTSVVVCCQLHPAYSVDTVLWVDLCDLHLGRALRASGIETAEQLKARLAPDPRVAVLDDVLLLTENAIRYSHLAFCRTLEREPEYLAEMKRIIAAQRGEGER